jgi:hypothetical protein
MYEHLGLAALLFTLALAGFLGETAPPCCATKVTVGPAVLLFP